VRHDSEEQESAEQDGALDREFLTLFGPDTRSTASNMDRLYEAASSVLLTLVVPDSDNSSEGHPLGLWTNPEALWTILTFNAPNDAVDNFRGESVEFLTPLAQFVRGVCAVIRSQRINLCPILDILKERLQKSKV